jgi:hypothetical protein
MRRADRLVRFWELVAAQLVVAPNLREKPDPSTVETGEQVTARPHDSGSQANETVDSLDASTEALRHAAEDTPTGTGAELSPNFGDGRAGQAAAVLG